MGTRAVIRFGKTRIATHWDGTPDSLGKDLAEIGFNPTLEKVIEVAKQHNIDFATKEVVELTSMERFENIAKKTKGKYTAQQLYDLWKNKGKHLVFGIQGPDDYPIDLFNGYNDFAKYEYDVTDKGVNYRELHGEYKASNDSPWKTLSQLGATN